MTFSLSKAKIQSTPKDSCYGVGRIYGFKNHPSQALCKLFLSSRLDLVMCPIYKVRSLSSNTSQIHQVFFKTCRRRPISPSQSNHPTQFQFPRTDVTYVIVSSILRLFTIQREANERLYIITSSHFTNEKSNCQSTISRNDTHNLRHVRRHDWHLAIYRRGYSYYDGGYRRSSSRL